jgi:hypothetical protein
MVNGLLLLLKVPNSSLCPGVLDIFVRPCVDVSSVRGIAIIDRTHLAEIYFYRKLPQCTADSYSGH